MVVHKFIAAVQLVSLSPRPTSRSTGCIASPRADDAIHPVLREVGLGDSETTVQYMHVLRQLRRGFCTIVLHLYGMMSQL